MIELLKIAVKAIDEKKGEEICVLDFKKISPFTDYFVITHVDNFRQLNAIVDNVVEKIEQAGFSVRDVEGDVNSGWQLIDAYDVVIHVFMADDRKFYGLEKLWADIPQIDINEIL